MRGLLIVNPRSGDGGLGTDELELAAGGREADVHVLAEGDDAQAIARAGEGPVGVAGGDGSLGAVAAVAMERNVPFVCVPFGTPPAACAQPSTASRSSLLPRSNCPLSRVLCAYFCREPEARTRNPG